jgi:hypothetical protein
MKTEMSRSEFIKYLLGSLVFGVVSLFSFKKGEGFKIGKLGNFIGTTTAHGTCGYGMGCAGGGGTCGYGMGCAGN